ncbi:MAG TPA: hypothetical protein PKD05_02235 [Candidatus Melainabacteria bacterium]|nr:hypothetical protein [Candidatus Melainabacteria bacterium]
MTEFEILVAIVSSTIIMAVIAMIIIPIVGISVWFGIRDSI